MSLKRDQKIDMGVAALIIVICAAFFQQSFLILENDYEPIGAAFLPKILCIAIAFLAALIFHKALKNYLALKNLPETEKTFNTPVDFEKKPLMAVACALVTVAYVGAMDINLLDFKVATVTFQVLLGAILTKLDLKRMAIISAIAVVIGIGGNYIFKDIFFVDLP